MLADNLIFLRNIKGLTQEQVAEVIGISRQSYSKWEQGETYPDIDKCDKLAKYYGVTIDSLVHQDNKVDDIKIAPAPIGKHLWGTATIGSKDGAFSFANKVPGVFENAKNAEGFVKITELKPSHRTRVAASICEECKTVIFKY